MFKIIFLKYYFGHTTFFMFVHTLSNEHHQGFFKNFRFSSRKSQRQQKLAKKITHFTKQFSLKNLTHFTNLNSLDIENNMLPQLNQKSFQFIIFNPFSYCSEETIGFDG